ncbi:MAG: hypothetical protein EOO54_23790, partial [Haliea sp.]
MKPSPSPFSAALALMACGLVACAAGAQTPTAVGVGPNPALPAPQKSIIPTVNIAPAFFITYFITLLLTPLSASGLGGAL